MLAQAMVLTEQQQRLLAEITDIGLAGIGKTMPGRHGE